MRFHPLHGFFCFKVILYCTCPLEFLGRLHPCWEKFIFIVLCVLHTPQMSLNKTTMTRSSNQSTDLISKSKENYENDATGTAFSSDTKKEGSNPKEPVELWSGQETQTSILSTKPPKHPRRSLGGHADSATAQRKRGEKSAPPKKKKPLETLENVSFCVYSSSVEMLITSCCFR